MGFPDRLAQPEDLPDIQHYLRSSSDRFSSEDMASFFLPVRVRFRPIDQDKMFHLEGAPAPRRDLWMRFPSAACVAGVGEQQALLAYLSDFWIGPVANDPHNPAFPKQFAVVTVSHSIAFHSPASADDWLLYRMESPGRARVWALPAAFCSTAMGI